MRKVPKSESRNNLIATLWGLLFTKCFLLEYLVRHYEVPINSRLYVWTLSILMATVATAVYANLQKEERVQLFKNAGFAIASLTFLMASLFVFWSLTAPFGQSEMALASAALILAVKHFWLAARKTRTVSRWHAPGWMVAAIGIAYLGMPAGFLIFAAGIVCLAVIPGVVQIVAQRKAKRASAPVADANS